MYSIPTVTQEVTYTIDVTIQYNQPDPTNVWLFTDPAAIQAYSQINQLDMLEQDIRTYVMFDGKWSADEMDYKSQVDEYIRSGILIPRPAFGHMSPHPTIYQAMEAGVISAGGESYPFDLGDEVVFEPWPVRLSHPGIQGPVRIGRLSNLSHFSLCREEFPQLVEMDEKQLYQLHKISCYKTLKNG